MVLFPAAAGPSIAITTRRRLLLIGLNQLLKQDFGFRISGDSVNVASIGGWPQSHPKSDIRNPKSVLQLAMNRRAFLATAAAGSLLAASDRVRIGLIGTGSRCM